MHIATRYLVLTLAAVLSGMVTAAYAAVDTPAAPATPVAVALQQPVAEVEVLDEIWVRGKHLSQVIEDEEDRFFKLYNKLNRNSDYDVFCGTMSLHPGSMIMVRKCAPGFIVYRFYSAINNTVSYVPTSFGSCSSIYPVTGSNGEAAYYDGGCSGSFGNSSLAGSRSYTPSVFSTGSVNISSSPAAGLLLEERSLDYGNNVLKVVTSDPRLLEMVRNLGGLYDEMETLQDRYITLKEAGQELRKARRKGGSNGGPRSP
jgi:hypothetical protein